MYDKLINQFMAREGVQNITSIFSREKIEICFVGGCIRDALIGFKSFDIDFAINCKPEDTITVLQKNNIEFEDYGKKYGSIVAKISDNKFEITSLREDFNQNGRSTDVKFINDWRADALRRDFTMNAIYLSPSGILCDYFEGQHDLANQQIKFIGNIDQRIQEDYLRIFRYYRFLGCFKNPQIIKDYELTIHNYCEYALKYLSNELVEREILKMLNNSFPVNSFCSNANRSEQNLWIKLTKENFIKNNYKHGLNKCLNKVNALFE